MNKGGRPPKRPKERRGGARVGAGRKTMYEKRMTRHVSFYMTDEQYDALTELAIQSGSQQSTPSFARALLVGILTEQGLL